MDYLTGVSLSKVLKSEGPLNPERARDIFVQVCAAVDHAHHQGVIHRDLKPQNIMLIQHSGQGDFVKVVDFGVAKFSEEAQKLTRLGEVLGSPVYMSPEQCMGAPLDPRSDVYSLGIVIYEALVGEVPFFGKKHVETMSQQINQTPRSFEQVRPDLVIPSRLEEVVMQALSKEPDKRQQTMAQLRAQLEKAILINTAEKKTAPKTKVSYVASIAPQKLSPSISQPSKLTQVLFFRALAVLIAVFCLLAVALAAQQFGSSIQHFYKLQRQPRPLQQRTN
jgi:serine/threonine protein kinase